jgi:hypothetical protein
MMIKSISDAKVGTSAGSVPPAEAMHDGIALRLRELYSDLENEGIPDNLLHLLEKLDEAERAQSMPQKSED